MNTSTLIAASVAAVLGALVLTNIDLQGEPEFGTEPCDLDFRPNVFPTDVMGRAAPHGCQIVRARHYLPDGTTHIETVAGQALVSRMTVRLFPSHGARIDPTDPNAVRQALFP